MSQPTPLPFERWPGVGKRPWVLAGPRLAAGAEATAETARRLRGSGVGWLASEAWGRPLADGSTPGAGSAALGWIRRAAGDNGLRAATAVASAEQVAAALAHGVDLLWVDGEATGAPAAMQRVAHALRGSQVPVLVAQPAAPDLELWMEGIERVVLAGVRTVGALQVGSPSGGPQHPRAPGWELVMELRRSLPGIAVVTAVSRIAEAREPVGRLAQSALDLGLEGLMVEADADPDHAWWHPERHLTPERLEAILAALVVRRGDAPEAGFRQRLEALRGEIDGLDRRLLALLAERRGIVDRIAELKRDNNVASLQVDRWRAMLVDRLEWARAAGVSSELVEAVFRAVHAASVERQGELMDRDLEPPVAPLGGEAPKS